jgi:ferredoxin
LELPGLLEAVGFGDLTTPYKKQFIKLWGKFKPIYVNEGISALGKHSMAWCAVGELPPDAKPEDNLFELIKGNDYFAVALCACRLIEQHAEHGNVCDHAMETCLYFGEIARWAVEQGHARQVSLDEALKMLNLCEEKGQVHVGLPNICICNCCKHACVMFSALKLGVDHIFFHNHFYAVVDAETCTSCGICIDRCPVASIQVDDTAVVDLDKCIGCGACATGCDENAIKMVRRSEEEIAKLDSACMEGFVKMMSRTTPDPLLRKVLER